MRTIKLSLALKAILPLLLIAQFVFAQPEIGLELYSFRNQLPKDVPGMLQKISQMGIRELEGGSTYGMSLDSFKMLLAKKQFENGKHSG